MPIISKLNLITKTLIGYFYACNPFAGSVNTDAEFNQILMKLCTNILNLDFNNEAIRQNENIEPLIFELQKLKERIFYYHKTKLPPGAYKHLFDAILFLIKSTREPLSSLSSEDALKLSVKRIKQHKQCFFSLPKSTPDITIPAMLMAVENKPILNSIHKIVAKGDFVIPMIIDHWTTMENFRHIICSGAFLGNKHMRDKKIQFTDNALSDCDIYNGDENSICFCPGGFVDIHALEGDDRIRVRIDVSKVNVEGNFNIFFKAIDFCVENYKTNLKLTNQLDVEIFHLNQCLLFKFIYKDNLDNIHEEQIELSKAELIFYGDLAGMNRFCLLLPFMALSKCKNLPLVTGIYEHLRELPAMDLIKTLVGFAQNITKYSEYNVNAILPLTPHLIYDIHIAQENLTYTLSGLSIKDYESTLNQIASSKPFELPPKAETILQWHGDSFHKNITFYGCHSERGPMIYSEDVNISQLSPEGFLETYIETRKSNRTVPTF